MQTVIDHAFLTLWPRQLSQHFIQQQQQQLARLPPPPQSTTTAPPLLPVDLCPTTTTVDRGSGLFIFILRIIVNSIVRVGVFCVYWRVPKKTTTILLLCVVVRVSTYK
eukprot:GHVS01059077.1.p1 GENE.GHVS01059077.1~~GHVS01059077.1.p1  ORF type:complete len:108 (-),score=26.54 GHVS01059077.1:300-623(-)